MTSHWRYSGGMIGLRLHAEPGVCPGLRDIALRIEMRTDMFLKATRCMAFKNILVVPQRVAL